MTKKDQPLVVITHQRDWPLLELLANSLTKYLDLNHPLYVITNDFRNVPVEYYKDKLIPILAGRDLTVIDQSEFGYVRANFPDDSGKTTWQWVKEGWVNQQVLKLAVASILPTSVKDYLVLDCQNFLVRPWEWPKLKKTPYRLGGWSMHNEIWDQLCKHHNLKMEYPDESLATPIFLNKNIVNDMIDSYGGLIEFSRWFVNISHLVSEFATYLFWAKMNNRWKEHKEVSSPVSGEKHPDWAIGYLRDGGNFNFDFDELFENLNDDSIMHRGWASINYKAWGQMSEKQYKMILDYLKSVNLVVNMSDLRNN